MGPLGESLLAWVLLPLLLYAASLGVGLLVVRLLRLEVSNALLAPFGASVAILLVMPGYRLGLGAWFATPLVVLAAGAGFVMSRGDWRAWINPGWAGVAALAVYGLYLAPVVLAGGWTWPGYNFVNDTAVQLQLVDHLNVDGLHKPIESLETEAELEHTSTSDAALFYYLRAAYPVGSHALLAALAPLAIAPTAALYAPFIAGLAALAAMALAALVGRLLEARWAALAAFAALAANLTYAYALQGNVKEIALIATLTTAAAMGWVLLRSARPVATGVATALCLAAVLAVYGGAGIPFVGVLAVALLVAALLQRDSPVRAALVPTAAAAAATLVVGGLIAAQEVVQSVKVLNDAFGVEERRQEAASAAADGAQVSELGHLLRELPVSEMAGVWLGEDYRVPVPPGRAEVNAILIGLMVAAAVIGVVWLVRRRGAGPLMLLATALVTLVVVGPRVSPYAEAKLLAVGAPALVLAAAFGVAALARRFRLGALILAAVLLGGIMLSNAYAYHAVQLAPTQRLEDLERVAERYKGRGEVMLAENEEFGKYLMRDVDQVTPFDSVSPRQVQELVPQSTTGRHFDLDEQRVQFVSSFPWIVQRRSPAASRPPANFRLDYEDRWYRVWRRTERPQVLQHLPLQTVHERALRPHCSDVRALAERAGPGERIVAVRRRPSVQLDPLRMRRTFDWPQHPIVPDAVVTTTPGESWARLRFEGGRYRVWIRGTFGREIEARLDGRRIGAAKGVDTPGSWHDLGVAEVEPGTHRIEMHRGGGGLAPGDGYLGALGPLAFEPLEPARLIEVSPRDWRSLCGHTYDWLERVRP